MNTIIEINVPDWAEETENVEGVAYLHAAEVGTVPWDDGQPGGIDVRVVRWDTVRGFTVTPGSPEIRFNGHDIDYLDAADAQALARLLEAAADLIDPQ